MDASEADAGGEEIGGEMAAVARERLGRGGGEDDAALAALEIPAAVVVEIKAAFVEDFEKEPPGVAGHFSKSLDGDGAFP